MGTVTLQARVLTRGAAGGQVGASAPRNVPGLQDAWGGGGEALGQKVWASTGCPVTRGRNSLCPSGQGARSDWQGQRGRGEHGGGTAARGPAMRGRCGSFLVAQVKSRSQAVMSVLGGAALSVGARREAGPAPPMSGFIDSVALALGTGVRVGLDSETLSCSAPQSLGTE